MQEQQQQAVVGGTTTHTRQDQTLWVDRNRVDTNRKPGDSSTTHTHHTADLSMAGRSSIAVYMVLQLGCRAVHAPSAAVGTSVRIDMTS